MLLAPGSAAADGDGRRRWNWCPGRGEDAELGFQLAQMSCLTVRRLVNLSVSRS